MRWLLIILMVLTFTLALSATPTAKKWTILIYLDADNNLEPDGIDDINEMEQVGSNADVNIIVQLDRISGYDASNGDWTDTRRFYITKDSDISTISSTRLDAGSPLGELNMGAEATLQDFLTWGMTTYPAEHFMVVLWNHGGGWRQKSGKPITTVTKGVCWDDTNNDYLTMAEVNQAVNTVTTNLSTPITIFGFDACIMALVEVAYMVKGPDAYPTQALIFSQANEPSSGWAYDTFLPAFTTTPDATVLTLGQSVVDSYYEEYTMASTTLSLADMTKLPALITALDSFTDINDHWSVINDAVGLAGVHNSSYRDLIQFADHCRQNMTGSSQTAANDLYNAADDFIVYALNTGTFATAKGVNIYFPSSSSDGEYSDYTAANTYMLNAVPWKTFLENFYASDKTPPVAPDTITALKQPDDSTIVSWNSVTGATGYQLKRQLVSSTVFSDTFEAGTSQWSTLSDSGYSAFTLSTAAAHSSSHSMFSSSGNNLKIGMRSQSIVIPSDSNSYELSFFLKYDIEAGYDYLYLEVDDGSTRNNLLSLSATSSVWNNFTFDLSAYKGKTISLIFRYVTDSDMTNAGAYIDDVKIIACTTDLYDNGSSVSKTFTEDLTGNYYFSVRAYDASNNYSSYSAATTISESGIPFNTVVLRQNYPNPMNPTTEIQFGLAVTGKVTLAIYDNAGRKIKVLYDGIATGGYHSVTWDGKDSHGRQMPSGVYYYSVTSPVGKSTKKLILLK